MRVLTWNLFHGRADPPAGRDLLPEFTAALARWSWDVALLQEVPPWWTGRLGAACEAQVRGVFTSRNSLLPLRRMLAQRRPDTIKSNGGGANAILLRSEVELGPYDSKRLRLRPERRVVHGVELGGTWIGTWHGQVDSEDDAQADARAAGAAILRWAGPTAPVILGGDANTSRPVVDGLVDLGGHGVDRVLARGFERVGEVELPERGELSDHAAVVVELTPTSVTPP